MKACVPRRDWLRRIGRSVLGWVLSAGIAGVGLLPATGAQAHDYRAGDLVIDHPYATPSLAGSRTGALYLRTLRNTGSQPDRLLGASSPVAESVEIHQMQVDAGGVMRMRALPALELPAGSEISLKHGGSLHLMLLGLTQPLKAGERVPVTLRFERAGAKDISVWVIEPRAGAAQHQH